MSGCDVTEIPGQYEIFGKDLGIIYLSPSIREDETILRQFLTYWIWITEAAFKANGIYLQWRCSQRRVYFSYTNPSFHLPFYHSLSLFLPTIFIQIARTCILYSQVKLSYLDMLFEYGFTCAHHNMRRRTENETVLFSFHFVFEIKKKNNYKKCQWYVDGTSMWMQQAITICFLVK